MIFHRISDYSTLKSANKSVEPTATPLSGWRGSLASIKSSGLSFVIVVIRGCGSPLRSQYPPAARSTLLRPARSLAAPFPLARIGRSESTTRARRRSSTGDVGLSRRPCTASPCSRPILLRTSRCRVRFAPLTGSVIGCCLDTQYLCRCSCQPINAFCIVHIAFVLFLDAKSK